MNEIIKAVDPKAYYYFCRFMIGFITTAKWSFFLENTEHYKLVYTGGAFEVVGWSSPNCTHSILDRSRSMRYLLVRPSDRIMQDCAIELVKNTKISYYTNSYEEFAYFMHLRRVKGK